MSAYDTVIAWTRGKTSWMADLIALATKARDDIAALTIGGLTNALVYGARETTSAVDVTLVAADSLVQAVTMTAASMAVNMPDATTDVEGQPWVIYNAGTIAFAVKDNAAGTILAALAPGDTVVVRLLDGATAAGAWVAENHVLQGKHAIPVIARSLTPTTTLGCAAVAQGETTTNKINYEYLAFDASTEWHCFVKFPAPKSSDETAGFYIRNLKWSHPATTTNFGVVWGFAMLAVGNDDTLEAALGTEVTVTDTGGTTEDIYSADESTVITPAGTWAEGDDLYLEVARVAADGSDTMAVEAYLHGFEIIITTNAGNDA